MTKEMMRFIRTYEIEILIFALALVVRLLYLGFSIEAANGDFILAVHGADGYYVIAQNISAGHGFSAELSAPYTLTSVRPPLWPYFLAVTHMLPGGYGASIFLEIIMACFLPILGMKLARYIISSRIAIILTGVFLAIEPYAVHLSTVFYSDVMLMFFLFLSVLFLFKYFSQRTFLPLAVSAVCIGLATLTKPVAEYLPILFVAIILWDARRALSRKVVGMSLLYLVIFAAVITPWLYRNYALFDSFALTPQLQGAAYRVLVPSVLAIAHHTSWQQEEDALLAQGSDDINHTSFASSQGGLAKTIQVLRSHKKAAIETFATVAITFMTHDGMLDILDHLGYGPNFHLGRPALFLFLAHPLLLMHFIALAATQPVILVLVMRLWWVGMAGLFFLGSWRYVRHEGLKSEGMTAFMLVMYFMLATMLIGLAVNARYHVPVEPFIFVFALYGASSLAATFHRQARLS